MGPAAWSPPPLLHAVGELHSSFVTGNSDLPTTALCSRPRRFVQTCPETAGVCPPRLWGSLSGKGRRRKNSQSPQLPGSPAPCLSPGSPLPSAPAGPGLSSPRHSPCRQGLRDGHRAPPPAGHSAASSPACDTCTPQHTRAWLHVPPHPPLSSGRSAAESPAPEAGTPSDQRNTTETVTRGSTMRP